MKCRPVRHRVEQLGDYRIISIFVIGGTQSGTYSICLGPELKR